MRLQEITGYKQTDVYQLFLKSPNVSSFTRKMNDAGYEKYLVGKGYYAGVFHRPEDPFVIKFYKNDPQYDKYLKFVIDHQDNPHVPKVYGRPVTLKHPRDEFSKYRIVRLEKLDPVGSNPDHREIAKYFFAVEKNKEYYEKLVERYPNIKPVLNFLLRKKDYMDINSDNFMFRGDTPVITDPWHSLYPSPEE